jgi:hypothetical protein
MKVLLGTHLESHLKLGEHDMNIMRIIQESEKNWKFPLPTSNIISFKVPQHTCMVAWLECALQTFLPKKDKEDFQLLIKNTLNIHDFMSFVKFVKMDFTWNPSTSS